MNHKSRNQMILLVILLGLLTLSIFSQITGGTRTPVAPSTLKSSPAVEVSASTEVLQMHLLDNDVPELDAVKRNIFQFEGRQEIVQDRPSQIQIPQQPIVMQPPAVPNVRYLGFYLEKESGLKLAAISNSGKIYVGKVGQILGGKYEILEIASDHLLLRLTQDGKILNLPLGKGIPDVADSDQLDSGEEEE